ncbi:MAG: TIGR03560 family F420-dependent LLM class oxidoreductase [Segniliparus sp.]|uniref:TIGR03560 family F420-dependent LLM class oxidoreductase n=1 Tax=Segniliparus sp. TaxID=2804064 RepID=UPI003F3411D1
MKFSVWGSTSQSWPDLLELANLADSGGWHSLYLADHFMARNATAVNPGRPMFEAAALLAALAAATTRVRLAPLVLSMTYRHPAVLANWASTVDQISNGRLTLGLGAGWQENEHTAYGIALGTPKERVDRFEEGLRVVKSLLSHTATTFHGEHYRLEAAVCEPKPIQENLPVLVGASGPRMLSLVAELADEWNTWTKPGEFRKAVEPLEAACEKRGRDPRSVHRSTQAWFLLDDEPGRVRAFEERTRELPGIAGTPQQIAEAAAVWKEEGVDEVIVRDDFLGLGHRRRDNYEALWEAFADLR